ALPDANPPSRSATSHSRASVIIASHPERSERVPASPLTPSVDHCFHLCGRSRDDRAGRRLLETPRDQRCPPGLVAGAEATPRLGMEMLVEQHQVPPARIACVTRIAAVARPVPILVRREEPRQAAG